MLFCIRLFHMEIWLLFYFFPYEHIFFYFRIYIWGYDIFLFDFTYEHMLFLVWNLHMEIWSFFCWFTYEHMLFYFRIYIGWYCFILLVLHMNICFLLENSQEIITINYFFFRICLMIKSPKSSWFSLSTSVANFSRK